MTVTVNNSNSVHPESLEGLIVLRDAGLIRREVNVETQNQCSAWGQATKFDDEGRLIFLDLGGCRLRKGLSDGVVAVFGSQLSSIQILNLGGTDLPVADTLKVLQLLSDTLEEIHLGGNGLSDAHVKKIASEWLPKASHLKILDLRYNDITGAGCEALCEGIRQQSTPTLEKLYMEGNRISDQGSESMAKLLASDPSISEVFLGANSISSVGAAALAQCLKTSAVTKLYLEGNNIQEAGAEAFTKVLLECNGDISLKHLFVDNNDIGKEGSKRLAQALNSATAIGDSL